MKIKTIMRTNVPTLTNTHTIEDAIALMESASIRHIPITNGDTAVIGIVSDRDIRDIRPSTLSVAKEATDFLQPVTKIMSTPVLTAHPDDDVQEVARLFFQHRVGCLPVVDNDRLAGLITESDMLYSLTKLLGADQPSSIIEVCVHNRPGQLADVATVFKKERINIVSAVAYPSKKADKYMLSFRVQTIDPRRIIAALQLAGYEVYNPPFPVLGGSNE
jgi:acetoin utilization protein AcuB